MLSIGQLAKRVECPVETLRYWEKEGLLPTPYRGENNYRWYQDSHLERALFIRNCRNLDMSLAEIRQLLSYKDQPDTRCDQVNRLLDEHISHVTERIASLTLLKETLESLRQRCVTEKNMEACEILAGLSCDQVQGATDKCSSHLRGAHPGSGRSI